MADFAVWYRDTYGENPNPALLTDEEARELGRLVRAVENQQWGPEWLTLRNAAMIALMARAGLRVGEVVALDLGDVEINSRSGWVTIRQGKGLRNLKRRYHWRRARLCLGIWKRGQ